MGPRDQDSNGAPTLAGLLLRGRPAPREKTDSGDSADSPRSRPAAGQMNLLFSVDQAAPQPKSVLEKDVVPTQETAVHVPRTVPVQLTDGVQPATTGHRSETHRIWTVRSLVGVVRETVEAEFEDLWVRGEISNCRPAPSGHLYFTLKDGEAQLSVVLFRRQAQLLRFAPRDGMEVIARGRVSVFDQRGQLQLIAESLEPRGVGSLQLAFEQLKEKLLAEGLFDEKLKRPLPPFPHRIGVITSPAGAVIHDMIRVIRRRHACLDLLVYPAVVQGPECAPSVIEGLRWFQAAQSADSRFSVDLIVIARGGGSLEDLAGFNEESLARAIASSELPVVSAIGHETDFTIADFVADLRAPTPSAAAEMITAAQHRIEERVHGLADRLVRAIRYQVIVRRQSFTRLSTAYMPGRARDGIARRLQVLDELRRRLDTAMMQRVSVERARLDGLQVRVSREEPRRELGLARRRVEAAERSLPLAVGGKIGTLRGSLDRASGRLAALSPLAVLGRGYALVYASDGSLLRAASQVTPGETIRARLAQGTVRAAVLPERKQ